jgi:hypothetical protein
MEIVTKEQEPYNINILVKCINNNTLIYYNLFSKYNGLYYILFYNLILIYTIIYSTDIKYN